MKDQNCYELNHVVNILCILYIMILIIYFKVKLKHKITYQTVHGKKKKKKKLLKGNQLPMFLKNGSKNYKKNFFTF